MVTINKALESLTLEDIVNVSNEYLMGWHDLSRHGFRLKGLNNKRVINGMEPLTKDMSLDFRVNYIEDKYSYDEIYDTISEYLKTNRVADQRWTGIELLDCRFGREYAKAFKRLLGNKRYRELSEVHRKNKSVASQIELYGGVGLAGKSAREKAVNTNIDRYGVENVMQNKDVKARLGETNAHRYGGPSPFSSDTVQRKGHKTRISNINRDMDHYNKTGEIPDSLFKLSPYERVVFEHLVSRFGKDDVFYQYGVHPRDERYPYHCDFYIKSLDLFIEINAHYSHGNHWYDDTNHEDRARRQHLATSTSKRSRNALTVWCDTDLKKRDTAKLNHLNYLVFWDSQMCQKNKVKHPRLQDFFEWLEVYDCDTESFLKQNPENTY